MPVWSNPGIAGRRVRRLSKVRRTPGRYGPIDVAWAAIDRLRASRRRDLIEAGLLAFAAATRAGRRPSSDELARVLHSVDATRWGLRSNHPEVRRSAVRLELQSSSGAVAQAVLEGLLADPEADPRTAEAAVSTLSSNAGNAPTLTTARRMLFGTPTGNTRFDTSRLALARSPACVAAVRAWVGGVREADRRRLARAVRSLHPATAVVAALRLEPVIPDAAAARLGLAASEAEFLEILSLNHLALARPAAFRTAAALSTRSQAPTDPLPVRRGVLALCRSGGFTGVDRHRVVVSALADPDRVCRAVGASVAPPSLLEDFALDTDARIARSAALRRSSIGRGGGVHPAGAVSTRLARRTGLLERSPHAAIRRLARQEPVGGVLDLARRDQARAAVRLRAAVRADPDAAGAVRAELLSELPEPDTSDEKWFAAAGLVRRAGLAAAFEDELIEALRRTLAVNTPHADRRAATAIHMLDRSTGRRARRAVALGLNHPDPRVRANAVEASADDSTQTDRFAADDHHRVRANVVRGWATAGRQREAIEGVGRLLDDRRRLPVLAGLWAFPRVCLGNTVGDDQAGRDIERVVGRAVELAEDSPDERVAARARLAVSRVFVELKSNSKAAPHPDLSRRFVRPSAASPSAASTGGVHPR